MWEKAAGITGCQMQPTLDVDLGVITYSSGGVTQAAQLLQQAMQTCKDLVLEDPMDGQEARLWLMAAQGQAEPASSSEGWQRLKQLLLDGAAPSRACKQLLQVACEERPDLVAACLADLPSIPRNLFQRSHHCIQTWFGCFLGDSIGRFKFGARALSQYALANRARVWEWLVWAGRHPHAPVAVASRPSYFAELNVVKTVLNLLTHEPGFLESQLFQQSLSSDFVALDQTFLVEELFAELQQKGSSHVHGLMREVAVQLPWRLLCKRLLPAFSEGQLLGLSVELLPWREVSARLGAVREALAGGSTAAGHISEESMNTPALKQAVDRMLLAVLFGGVRWSRFEDLLVCCALAMKRLQLAQRCRQPSHRQMLKALQQCLAGPNGSYAGALLRCYQTQSISLALQQLVLHAWLVYVAAGECSGHDTSGLQSLLTHNNIKCELLTTGQPQGTDRYPLLLGKRHRNSDSKLSRKKHSSSRNSKSAEAAGIMPRDSRDNDPPEVDLKGHFKMKLNGCSVTANYSDMPELLFAHALLQLEIMIK